MRRTRVLVAIISVLALGSLLPAGAVIDADAASPVPGVSITSDNVEHIGYLPEMGPTVSGRILDLDDGRWFYVSSTTGLSIYDIDDPATPVLTGRLPIPGFQNEDMAVSSDGDVALLAFGDANQRNFLIDTSDRSMPTHHATFGESGVGGGDHTLECATPDCQYAYGSTTGRTYEIRNEDGSLADGSVAGSWRDAVQDQIGHSLSQGAHKLVRDAEGYVNVDSVPRVMFDPRDDALEPEVLTTGLSPAIGPDNQSLRYQHNNLRPRAETWEPRDDEDYEATKDLEPASEDPLRDGELLLIGGETNFATSCGSANGPFATVSVRNFDRGEEMETLEVFRPSDNGNYLDGNPAVNALGCSNHWFDVIEDPASDELLVSAAWFEHGVRFIEVEAATGAINEVGFFQPVNGSAGATYWLEEDGAFYVFTTDYVRGVDILRFDPDPDLRPTERELAENWAQSAQRPTPPATIAEQRICTLAVQE